MFYISVIQYFDKTKIWLKIASKEPLWPLTPCFLHSANAVNQPMAPDYYFCFLQVGTSAGMTLRCKNSNQCHIPYLHLTERTC